MAGLEEPDAGGVLKPSALTIGYLPQDGLAHSGRTVYDEVATAFQRLLDVRTEMHALETRLGDASVAEGEHEAMLVRYAELTRGVPPPRRVRDRPEDCDGAARPWLLTG